ncbi:hypothetical protein ACIA5C_45125 [Actinoplanes sp. NPDC051343]|uniref:hypothetical protein n=1 Tax=Actinoplanes sp. NPDC051343 TaxID=3363906 RepID=UPI0037BD3906
MTWKSFINCVIAALADAGMADDWGLIPTYPGWREEPTPAVFDADDATVREMFDDIVGRLDQD